MVVEKDLQANLQSMLARLEGQKLIADKAKTYFEPHNPSNSLTTSSLYIVLPMPPVSVLTLTLQPVLFYLLFLQN